MYHNVIKIEILQNNFIDERDNRMYTEMKGLHIIPLDLSSNSKTSRYFETLFISALNLGKYKQLIY